jgi:hypothetical protein
MLKDVIEIEKLITKMKIYNLSQLELICQTRNTSNEMKITSYKVEQNKSQTLILIQPNVEWWNWGKKVN